MTRLRTEDIDHIPQALSAYDQELLKKTGKPLRGIASYALGRPEQALKDIGASCRVSVIPMTCGQGIIDRFCESVSSIVCHLGFHSGVTEHPDVAGVAEAFAKQADIILMADDSRFVAINTHTRYVSDNIEMTARGFVAGLDLMVGGLQGQDVLVIGCGDLGRCSAKTLVGAGARISVCDTDPQPALRLQADIQEELKTVVHVDNDWHSTPGKYACIIDATPAADFIDVSMITLETCIAGPGVPCGLSPAARERLSNRCLHDPLQIGVATMVLDALTHDG
jgi:pyrrolysine biosynthesis protein PylD